MKKVKHARLGRDVIPHHYKVELKPDLEAFTFEGSETITIEVKKSTKKITLHAAELELLSIEYVRGEQVLKGKVSYNKAQETATLSFAKLVPKGRGALNISFTGILNNQMRGFYRSRYELDGKEHHMAVTQFESTDARRAIPCFDEPSHKAVFEVSLIVPNDRTAISNTLETSIKEHSAGYKAVSFAPSPKMSSYLLAFIVGHFEHIQKKTKRGVMVRVFVTPGKKHQAEFALDCAVKCIDFYEKYFGIKYPLPVADLIAIPDFASGAMENWGAVTYRETAILVDPVHTATANKQRVAIVIAHELAHQWFGNLVTMEWWTHLWLNEGFATYLEYVAVNAVYPKWNIWTQFVHQENGRALSLDSLDSTHAIEIAVHHPGEISEIFDAVSYAKGASVIRMLQTYIGEKAFQKGLSHYLKKHAYGNAETADLWKAFERASGKKVRALMHAWTHTPGYPLVTLSGGKVSQKRFYASAGKKGNGRWTIPTAVVVGGAARTAPLLITKVAQKIKLPKGTYYKLNAGETSFVRSAYDAQNLDLLTVAIAKGDKKLTEVDRYGIVRDVFALAEAGQVTTAQALALASAYRFEQSYVVWAILAEYLHKIRSLIHETELEADFNLYVRELTRDIVKRVGWEASKKDAHDTALLRAVVLTLAGVAENTEVLAHAKKLFADLVHGKHVDANVRSLVCYLTAKNGGHAEYQALHTLYTDTTLEEEKDRFVRALCSVQDPTLLKKQLEQGFSSHARGQDSLKAMAFVWSNPHGRDVAWDYLTHNWDAIAKRFDGGHLFPRLLQPAGTEVSVDRAHEIKKFMATHQTHGMGRTAAQVVEQILTNAAWLKRDYAGLKAFLSA